MRKWLLTLLLLAGALGFAFLLPPVARAQNPVKFNSLEIDLWPEYDRPTLLVIFRAILDPGVSLPARLTIRIPSAAGKPTAVAAGAALDSVADVDYQEKANGDWSEISFLATGPAVQLEYYDPGLVKEGALRRYKYTWPGDYPVDSLAIQVQQPVDATTMTISPALDKGQTSQDGLVYYNKKVGSLSAGEPFSLDLSYQKTTDTLSVKNLPVEPITPINGTSNFRSSLMAVLPWLLGLLGVVLLVGGGLWYWQSGRTGSSERSEVRRRRKRVGAPESVPAEGYIYCHNCGKRAGPGDRFCRTCGTRLRVE